MPTKNPSNSPASEVKPRPMTSRAVVGRALGTVLRALGWTLGVLVIAAVLLVGGLWWWSGRDGSLARAISIAARWQPIEATDVRGALRNGGHIGRLTWKQDGLSVEARDVNLSWQPLDLLLGSFSISTFSAGSVSVTDTRPAPETPTPLAPPASLGLPLRIDVQQISIQHFVYEGSTRFEATGFNGNYNFDGIYHALAVSSLQVAQGRYTGTGKLGAYGELPLDLQLAGSFDAEVQPGASRLPLAFDAQARGPITELDVKATLRTRAEAPAADAPQATLDARIAPFNTQPVRQAELVVRRIDLAALWPGAPQTLLSGDAHVRPDATRPDAWTVAATLDNARPGPVDQQRVPLSRLEAEGEWRAGVGLVRSLKALAGGGELTASGEWTDADALKWKAKAQARGIDPRQIYSTFAAQPLSGEASAEGTGGSFGFDARLASAQGALAAGASSNISRAASASAGARVSAATPRARSASAQAVDLRALRLAEARARGRWSPNLLELETLLVRTDDARLEAAALRIPVPVRGASGRVDFTAPGIRLNASGDVRETAGNGRLDLTTDDAARALAWLRKWPGAKDALAAFDATGNATLAARWQGGWRDPALDARMAAPSLDVTLAGSADAIKLRAIDATVNGKIANAKLAVAGRVMQGERQLTIKAAAEGGQPGYSAARGLASWSRSTWQASLTELSAALQDPALNTGTSAWRVATRGPVALRWSPQAQTSAASGSWFEASAGEAVLNAPSPANTSSPSSTSGTQAASASSASSATISWQPVRWRPGELVTAGRIRGLPLAWIETIAGPQLAGLGMTGSLVFDGSWDATLGETLRLAATLERSSGDLTVSANDGLGGSTRIAAGVRAARLTLNNEGDRVNLALRWDTERAGTAEGRLATRLSRNAEGGWQWPPDAALDGRLSAQLPRIGVWSVLAPPGWRLRGSLATDLAISGTRAAPLFNGNLSADDLALRSVVDGIEFGNGKLRARLAGTRLLVDEFMLEGAGERGAGGTLIAKGEAGWIDGRAQARLDADIKQLRASIRTDRQVTVSGQLAARLDGRTSELKGSLNVDRALIVLPDESKPSLGDDVVVISGGAAAAGAKAPAETSASAPAYVATTDNRTLALAVKLDLGRDFRIQGKGVDTRVRGTLDVTGTTLAAPRITGAIRTVGGQYRAYGQRLDIEQGVVIFSGPPDNPSLDILALRANMLSDQKVGVQITGSAMLPRIRLYASPEMSDAEKLSWLVLGRSSASGGAEAALLQQAALALLGSRGGGGMSGGIASALGLDELSVRGSATNESGATTEGAITLGKRFSRNFYAAYERSISGALGTLFVFYDLSQRFTIRAQAGEQSAVDLIFTIPFD